MKKKISLVESVLGIKCVLFLSMTLVINNFYCDVMLEMFADACIYSRKMTIIFA
jgi:hypothetical protein